MKFDIKKIDDKVTARLDKMLDRSKTMRSFLNTQVYSTYKKKQINRWQTEGASEGSQWYALDPAYKKYKAEKYAKYPYSGTKMLIATGKLFQAVVGEGGEGAQFHRKVVTDTMLSIFIVKGSDFEYPQFVDDQRPFTIWSDATIHEIKKMVSDYQNAAGI